MFIDVTLDTMLNNTKHVLTLSTKFWVDLRTGLNLTIAMNGRLRLARTLGPTNEGARPLGCYFSVLALALKGTPLANRAASSEVVAFCELDEGHVNLLTCCHPPSCSSVFLSRVDTR